MNTYNWSRFDTRININSSLDSIYKMWATSAGMERWFLRECEVSDKGGMARAAADLVTTGDQFFGIGLAGRTMWNKEVRSSTLMG